MLVIAYEGWFQCRMASDPDPTNDPRGISGPTIAVAGEPDFDRVIRLQDPICPRYPHETDIGVDARAVGYVDPSSPPGTPPTDIPGHPLVGAKVAFLTLGECGGSPLAPPSHLGFTSATTSWSQACDPPSTPSTWRSPPKTWPFAGSFIGT